MREQWPHLLQLWEKEEEDVTRRQIRIGRGKDDSCNDEGKEQDPGEEEEEERYRWEDGVGYNEEDGFDRRQEERQYAGGSSGSRRQED